MMLLSRLTMSKSANTKNNDQGSHGKDHVLQVHTWCRRWPDAARRLPQSPEGTLCDDTAAQTLRQESKQHPQ